ncbi:MAG: DUF2752 domain-containing protein [Candidatus Nanoarchaeia archaeon]|nr:DUF2752 domain-containing protein [Candidatus Nanoarchaeia archaeon]
MGRQIKKVFGDLISFGTPQAIVINIFLIFLIFTLIPTSTLENKPSLCIFKNIILPFIYNNNCPTEGIFKDCECPGCGLTRAMSSLMHGNLKDALNYNKGIIPLVLTMIVFWIINLRKSIKHYKKTNAFF